MADEREEQNGGRAEPKTSLAPPRNPWFTPQDAGHSAYRFYLKNKLRKGARLSMLRAAQELRETATESDRRETLAGEFAETRDQTAGTAGRAQEANWSEQKNVRRCELVDKEIAGNISATEQAELDRLQSDMLAYRRKVAPLPLDDLRELHEQLLGEVASSSD